MERRGTNGKQFLKIMDYSYSFHCPVQIKDIMKTKSKNGKIMINKIFTT